MSGFLRKNYDLYILSSPLVSIQPISSPQAMLFYTDLAQDDPLELDYNKIDEEDRENRRLFCEKYDPDPDISVVDPFILKALDRLKSSGLYKDIKLVRSRTSGEYFGHQKLPDNSHYFVNFSTLLKNKSSTKNPKMTKRFILVLDSSVSAVEMLPRLKNVGFNVCDTLETLNMIIGEADDFVLEELHKMPEILSIEQETFCHIDPMEKP